MPRPNPLVIVGLMACLFGAGLAQESGTAARTIIVNTVPPGAEIFDPVGDESVWIHLGAADGRDPIVLPLGVPWNNSGQPQELAFKLADHRTAMAPVTLGQPTVVELEGLTTAVKLADQWQYHKGSLMVEIGLVLAGMAAGLLLVVRFVRKSLPATPSVRTTVTLVGRVFDGYELTEELGQGAFSHVFKAVRVETKEAVAMKVLKSEFLDAQASDALSRFHREAMVHLQHKNVVQVYGCGDYQGRPYIVLELVAGTTLRIRLREPLSVTEALSIFLQMCRGLSFAHGRGYIHRDLKPENVMLLPDGTAKLMDFGIAKHLSRPAATRTATTMGTPLYMSPEHVDSSKTDARSDVYSMGIILFEMLTGRTPFDGDLMELISAHMYLAAPLLSLVDSTLPEELTPIVEKMLAKQREDRYQSMDAVIAALTQCCTRLNVPVGT